MATKIEEALEIIKGMTLLELRDLNKAIEEEFDITAAAPMMMAAAVAPAADGAGAAAEEQTEFAVVLKDFGPKKVNVIKAVREVVSGLGLKEAKELVEGIPARIKESVPKDEAEEIKAKIEEAGGAVDIE